jgi:hypothetical protein
MATTSNTYTGNGSNKLFSITFPYLDTSDIDVYLNGTLQTIITQYTFANATTVEFVAAPANGAVILLDRSTNDQTLQATFFPGSSIKANDLNFNFDQVLYLSQETANIVQNQSTAGLQTQITAANNTSNTALTTANAATVTANSANTTATGIAGTANTALTNANAAVVTANTATSTANAATVIANSALSTVSGLSGVNLNRIINGDMRIDQRNAGASVTPTNGQYTVDRWQANLSAASKFSVQQSSIAPAKFNNSLLCTSLSAYTVAAGEVFGISQYIEGFNTADLAWGTANATTVTLSFWVRSSLTGTFGGVMSNDGLNRSYPFTYTILSANTWEQKTVIISGDTTGTWAATTAVGIAVRFSLGAGSTYSGTAGSWAGSQLWNATGATSVVGTSGATFYITGVQLEPGSTATPFERRSYGQELSLCQRYYYRIGGNSEVGASAYTLFASGMLWNTGSGDFCVPFKVGMRSAPSITYGGTVAIQYQSTLGNVTSQSTVDGTTKNTAFLRMNTAQSWGAGPGCSLGASNDTTAFLVFNSEL